MTSKQNVKIKQTPCSCTEQVSYPSDFQSQIQHQLNIFIQTTKIHFNQLLIQLINRSECNSTRFPTSCITTLIPSACRIKPGDQPELCRVALKSSVNTSQNALQALLNISQDAIVQNNNTESGVISDCIDTYLTIIDYIMMASLMMNTRVISESTLVSIKQQISGLTLSVSDWESQCLKKVDRQRVRDGLKKKMYSVVAPCIKLNKIVSTLVNRIHI